MGRSVTAKKLAGQTSDPTNPTTQPEAVGDRVAAIRSRVLRERGDAVSSGSISTESIRAHIKELLEQDDPLRDPQLVNRDLDVIAAEVIGLGPLDRLLADPTVSEIMVNGPNQVWVERGGQLQRETCRITEEAIRKAIERIIGPLGLRIDRLSPYVDARLPDGSRLNAVVPPLAVDGSALTIRRFRKHGFQLSDFTDRACVESNLRDLVLSKKSFLISGPTGSGKTSLLSALSGFIGNDERVISIEDTAELSLQAAHVVRLEARVANVEGVGAITVRALVRNALRMRPDRLIVGEVRGAEAFDMIQAMNTGHRGSMSTVHANSASDSLRRLETLVLLADTSLPLEAIRRQISSALDVVVQVDRMPDGRRSIVEIAKVVGDELPRTEPMW
jgi:pilus assembly protein CpaF